jgi:hypothetical protein
LLAGGVPEWPNAVILPHRVATLLALDPYRHTRRALEAILALLRVLRGLHGIGPGLGGV